MHGAAHSDDRSFLEKSECPEFVQSGDSVFFSNSWNRRNRKDESGQSNPITKSYKTIQNMDSQASVEKTCLFWTAQELQVKTRLKEVELLSAKRRNQLPSAAVCPLLLDIDAPEYGASSPTTINYKLNSHCQNQSKNNQQ